MIRAREFTRLMEVIEKRWSGTFDWGKSYDLVFRGITFEVDAIAHDNVYFLEMSAPKIDVNQVKEELFPQAVYEQQRFTTEEEALAEAEKIIRATVAAYQDGPPFRDVVFEFHGVRHHIGGRSPEERASIAESMPKRRPMSERDHKAFLHEYRKAEREQIQ